MPHMSEAPGNSHFFSRYRCEAVPPSVGGTEPYWGAMYVLWSLNDGPERETQPGRSPACAKAAEMWDIRGTAVTLATLRYLSGSVTCCLSENRLQVARFGTDSVTAGQLGAGRRLQVTNQKRSVWLHCRVSSSLSTSAAESFLTAKGQTLCLVNSVGFLYQPTPFAGADNGRSRARTMILGSANRNGLTRCQP